MKIKILNRLTTLGHPQRIAVFRLLIRRFPDAVRAGEIGDLPSKNLDEFQQEGAPKMDYVLTVCDQAANEECQSWPGHPISGHWGIPDSAAVTGSKTGKQFAFEQAYSQMRA